MHTHLLVKQNFNILLRHLHVCTQIRAAPGPSPAAEWLIWPSSDSAALSECLSEHVGLFKYGGKQLTPDEVSNWPLPVFAGCADNCAQIKNGDSLWLPGGQVCVHAMCDAGG